MLRVSLELLESLNQLLVFHLRYIGNFKLAWLYFLVDYILVSLVFFFSQFISQCILNRNHLFHFQVDFALISIYECNKAVLDNDDIKVIGRLPRQSHLELFIQIRWWHRIQEGWWILFLLFLNRLLNARCVYLLEFFIHFLGNLVQRRTLPLLHWSVDGANSEFSYSDKDSIDDCRLQFFCLLSQILKTSS